MGRSPCCDKKGLRRGQWTEEEDQILISHIQKHGHGNWRALPKKAGLQRCGKSCRLRWVNYLRPDVKRGNFTAEEEDTIIALHQKLGNRWSAIAAQLPGRTDNEIKNIWNTHLKKRTMSETTISEELDSQLRGGHGVIKMENTREMSSPSDVSFEPCISTNGSVACAWENVFDQPLDDSSVFSSQSRESFEASFEWSKESLCVSTWEDGEGDMDYWMRVLLHAGQSPVL